MFNEAETAALAKFREDWPEEAKAVDLMQRELGRGVIQYVFDQIAPEVKQIKELVQTLALRAHQAISMKRSANIRPMKRSTASRVG
jgi:hypothetical protein